MNKSDIDEIRTRLKNSIDSSADSYAKFSMCAPNDIKHLLKYIKKLEIKLETAEVRAELLMVLVVNGLQEPPSPEFMADYLDESLEEIKKFYESIPLELVYKEKKNG